MKRLITLGLPSALFTLLLAAPALALFTSTPKTAVTETQTYQYDVIVRSQPDDTIEVKLLKGPKGMVLNSVNSLVWQTGYDDAGVYPIVLEAFDGHNTTQQAFDLTVHNKNQPPVITSRPLTTLKENDLFSYTIKTMDADGDTLRVEFLDKPKAMQIQGDTLTWQTDYQSAGDYPVHIRVHDQALHTDQVFVLSVKNVNRPPVFAPIDEAALQTQEDSQWQLTLAVSDADGDKVTLSLDNPPQGMTLDGNTLRWRPNFQQAGDYTVQVIADDGQDKSLLNLPIRVENVNRLPEFISQPSTSITETELYQYAIRAYDPDETVLRYRLLQGPEGMIINSQNQLLWQTGYDDAGDYSIKLEVSDGEASVEQHFKLTVINKNRPVQILSKPVTQIHEAELFSYTFEAIDPDGDAFTIDYHTIPQQVTRDGNVMTWQTDYKSAGKYPFIIRVSDAESTTEQAFILHVLNVNHKPVITSKPSLQAIEAVAYQYTLAATDADNEPLSFTLVKAPEGMKLRDTIVSWVPNFDQAGKHDVVIAVSDGIDTVTQAFTIDVADTNREPTLMDIDDQTVILGDTFRYQLEASDVDGDEVTLNLLRAPSAARINKHFLLSWRTKEKDLGEHIFIVEASDGDLKARKHFRVNVIEKPDNTK